VLLVIVTHVLVYRLRIHNYIGCELIVN